MKPASSIRALRYSGSMVGGRRKIERAQREQPHDKGALRQRPPFRLLGHGSLPKVGGGTVSSMRKSALPRAIDPTEFQPSLCRFCAG